MEPVFKEKKWGWALETMLSFVGVAQRIWNRYASLPVASLLDCLHNKSRLRSGITDTTVEAYLFLHIKPGLQWSRGNLKVITVFCNHLRWLPPFPLKSGGLQYSQYICGHCRRETNCRHKRTLSTAQGVLDVTNLGFRIQVCRISWDTEFHSSSFYSNYSHRNSP